MQPLSTLGPGKGIGCWDKHLDLSSPVHWSLVMSFIGCPQPKHRDKVHRWGRNCPWSLISWMGKVEMDFGGMRPKENNPMWIWLYTHSPDGEMEIWWGKLKISQSGSTIAGLETQVFWFPALNHFHHPYPHNIQTWWKAPVWSIIISQFWAQPGSSHSGCQTVARIRVTLGCAHSDGCGWRAGAPHVSPSVSMCSLHEVLQGAWTSYWMAYGPKDVEPKKEQVETVLWLMTQPQKWHSATFAVFCFQGNHKNLDKVKGRQHKLHVLMGEWEDSRWVCVTINTVTAIMGKFSTIHPVNFIITCMSCDREGPSLQFEGFPDLDSNPFLLAPLQR